MLAIVEIYKFSIEKRHKTFKIVYVIFNGKKKSEYKIFLYLVGEGRGGGEKKRIVTILKPNHKNIIFFYCSI